MINIKLLAEICEVAGAPGHEQRVREIVLREVKSLVDEIKIDNMGNVVAIKKGDLVVNLASMPAQERGMTNMMKISKV